MKLNNSLLQLGIFFFFILLILSCSSESEKYIPFSEEEDSTFVHNNYDKVEVFIPMRDGTKLFTAIYTPKDNKTYPILMYRTPYSVSPYGEENYKINLGPNMRMTRDKYIFVYQDVRGQFMSEGEFSNMTPHEGKNDKYGENINESTDTFDTIEWLLENVNNNNGKVGQWGISYPGFYTAAGMIDSHPALVAVSPQAPIADWFFDDFHHHGAFFLPHTFDFVPLFDQPKHGPTKVWPKRNDYGTNDGYEFFLTMTPLSKAVDFYLGDSLQFWNKIMEHPNYDDYWQSRNILPHLKNINCAVLTVGGWYDAEDLYGSLNIYQTIEKNHPNISNSIIMGPWIHGGWRRTDGDLLGNVHFAAKTSEFYNDQVIHPFFSHHLKGKGSLDLPEAYMFETGTNEWKKFDTWPPKEIKETKYYFRAKHKLSLEPARKNEFGMDFFVSDPDNPVPFIEEETLKMSKQYMTDDQRFVQKRSDVLYYETGLLAENVTFAGSLEANLVIKTSQSSADWIVKLIDVYPSDHSPFPHNPDKNIGNYQQMVRSEVLRGRFRNSYTSPEPFVPMDEYTVKVQLQDVLHTFKKGHKIMIQVQSTWFPLVDINPQKYVQNIYAAEEGDFVIAKHFIGRSGVKPSFLKVGILEREKD